MTLQLLETIAIVDGQIQNFDYHQQRYQQGMRFLTQSNADFALPHIIVPNEFCTGLVRCRVQYDIHHQQIEFFHYQVRNIKTYQMVRCDEIDYAYKYADREMINQLFAQRSECDDIIIVKHGKITDSSIGNLLFYKNGQWFTPSEPLLAGTQRAKLLDLGQIQLADIYFNHLHQFEKMMMINALNPFDEQRAISMQMVKRA